MTVVGEDNGNALGSGERKERNMKTFEREVTSVVDRTTVRLVSDTPDNHMNVVIQDRGKPHASATLTVSVAKRLRDFLLEAYPVEPEKFEYKVAKSYNSDWLVTRAEPSTFTKTIASATNEAHAKKIAQALNEAEGL